MAYLAGYLVTRSTNYHELVRKPTFGELPYYPATVIEGRSVHLLFYPLGRADQYLTGRFYLLGERERIR